MSDSINRRSFLKKSALAGGATLVGSQVLPEVMGDKTGLALAAEKSVISVVKGADYLKATIKAVDQLGGMGKFVPKGSRVAVLANAQRNNPGAFTSPRVIRAVARMCKEAGAKEVHFLSWLPKEAWTATGQAAAITEEGAELKVVDRKDESNFSPKPVPRGIALKEARIMNGFYNYDVFINMPITKDHAGNKFTGTLKNMMGLNSPKNNRTFHRENWATDPDSIAHMEQCIADLNTVIEPDLCIVDATVFITTNGPFGPGELIKPEKVVAGTDRVAIDAYCAGLWGLSGSAIKSIKMAADHGLGQLDSKLVVFKETGL
jgi:uncharacterized protein (DUF362 family)